eukprot:7385545-Prymnesium_polylepis.2
MGPHHGARQAAVVPQHPDVLRVVRARLEGVVPPPRAGDVGGAPAGRVGEPLLGAAAAHHHALPAARPDRLFGECVHHQQPRAEVHRAAGARPQPGARRLDCDGAAHLRALAGRRPDQPAVAARRAEADHVQHDRTRPGAGAARAAPHRQRRARGPLGAARQLPPDDVVARRARQDHRGHAGAPAAPAVPLVAVVGAARLLPDRHPAGAACLERSTLSTTLDSTSHQCKHCSFRPRPMPHTLARTLTQCGLLVTAPQACAPCVRS